MQVVGCGEEDEADCRRERRRTNKADAEQVDQLPSVTCKSDRMGSRTPTGDTGRVSPALWQSQSGLKRLKHAIHFG